MARSGRFGRLPRRAPDLTGEIVAMMREYERVREQNLLSAWREKGTFEGKKATDKMVLDFYRDKMRNVSKDDPLYEHYKNTVSQFELEIGESEMMLWYSQNKGNTRESKRAAAVKVAQWYRDQAKTVPRHSEIYRDLMRNASSYANAYRAQAKKETEADKRARYERQSMALYNQHEREAVQVGNLLTKFMREAGYLGGVPGATGKPGDTGEDLSDLDIDAQTGENDPHMMMLLFGALQDDPDFRKRVNRIVPNGGTLTRKDFVNMMKQRNVGLNERIKLARRSGYKSDIPGLQAQKQANKQLMAQTRLLDEYEQVSQIRYDLDSTFSDPNSSFSEKVNIVNETVKGLLKVRSEVQQTPGSEDSPLGAAINADIQQFTMGEDADTSRTGALAGGGLLADSGQGGETATTNRSYQQFVETLDALEQGEAGIRYTASRDEGTFGAGSGTPSYEIVPYVAAESAMEGDYVVQEGFMPTYDRYEVVEATKGEQFRQGGKLKKTTVPGYTYAEFLKTVPIYASANTVSDRTGAAIGGPAASDDNLLGKAVIDRHGEIIGYGVYSGGKLQWVEAGLNPFSKKGAVGPPTISPDGSQVVVNADMSVEGGEIGGITDKEGNFVTFDPASLIDWTVIPGVDPQTGEPTEGSQWAATTWAVARAMGSGENSKQVSRMTDEDWSNLLVLDPRYVHGSEQERATMEADLAQDLVELKGAQNAVNQGADFQDALTETRGNRSDGGWPKAEKVAEERTALAQSAVGQTTLEGAADQTRVNTIFGNQDISGVLDSPEAFAAYQSQEFPGTTVTPEKQAMQFAVELMEKTRDRVQTAASSVFSTPHDNRAEGQTISAPYIVQPSLPPTSRDGVNQFGALSARNNFRATTFKPPTGSGTKPKKTTFNTGATTFGDSAAAAKPTPAPTESTQTTTTDEERTTFTGGRGVSKR